jgi:hypothetical protein
MQTTEQSEHRTNRRSFLLKGPCSEQEPSARDGSWLMRHAASQAAAHDPGRAASAARASPVMTHGCDVGLGGAGTVSAFTNDGLFIGQSAELFVVPQAGR